LGLRQRRSSLRGGLDRLALSGVNGRELCDLDVLAGVHSRLDNSPAALERQIDQVSVQHEFHRKAGFIGLQNLCASPVSEKEWPLLVIEHAHVLALLAVVTNQLDL